MRIFYLVLLFVCGLLLNVEAQINIIDLNYQYEGRDNGIFNLQLDSFNRLYLCKPNGIDYFTGKEYEQVNSEKIYPYTFQNFFYEDFRFQVTIDGIYVFQGSNSIKIIADTYGKPAKYIWVSQTRHQLYCIYVDRIDVIDLLRPFAGLQQLFDASQTDLSIKQITEIEDQIMLATNKGILRINATNDIDTLTSTYSNFIHYDTMRKYFYSVGMENIMIYRRDFTYSHQFRFRDTSLLDIGPSSRLFIVQDEQNIYIFEPYLKFHHQFFDPSLYNRLHVFEFNQQQYKTIEIPEKITNTTSLVQTSSELIFGTLSGVFAIRKNNLNHRTDTSCHHIQFKNTININNHVYGCDVQNKLIEQLNDPDKEKIQLFLVAHPSETFHTIITDHYANILFFTDEDGIYIVNKYTQTNKHITSIHNMPIETVTYTVVDSINQLLYFSCDEHLYTWNGETFEEKLNIPGEFIYMFKLYRHNLYIATAKNVYIYPLQAQTPIKSILQEAKITKGSFENIVIHNDTLILFSSNRGIFYLHKINSLYQVQHHIGNENGLELQLFKTVIADTLHRIHLLNDIGLLQIIYPNKIISPAISQVIPNQNQKIADFTFENNLFTYYTDSSTYKLAANWVDDLSWKISKPFLQHIYIEDGQPTTHPENILGKQNFTYTENTLNFAYGVANYNKQHILFRVKLVGLDRRWSSFSAANNITYAHLAPGRYTFLLQCSTGGFISPVYDYSFEIHPAWWQTTIFTVASIIFLLGSIITITVFTVRHLHRKKIKENTIQMQLLQLQSSSVLNQMKSHFIFNLLSPLTSFIYFNKKEEALHYIQTLSSLIRDMLKTSRNKKIKIQDEIMFIQKYLSAYCTLKQQQFSFTIDSLIDNEIYIPSMMIQPIVENAIKYGIATHHGHISVSFTYYQQHYIQIDITDSGNGFDTQTIPSDNALSIIHDRINLYKQSTRFAESNIIFLPNKALHTFTCRLILPILTQHD